MKAPRSEGKEFEKCPTGMQLLVCSRVIDTGTHWVPPSEGKPGKDVRKLSLVFESQHLMTEGDFIGEPFLIYDNFNYSMYKNSHLCKRIEDWKGSPFKDQDEADDFDLSQVIGWPAFANVVQNGQYTNIQTINPVPPSMTAPEIKGKTILIDQTNLDPKEVEKLSEKMRERVMSAKEQTEGNFHQTGQGKMTQTSTHSTTMDGDLEQYNQSAPRSEAPPAGDDFSDEILFIRIMNEYLI